MTPYISFRDTYWGLKLDDMISWIHVERINNNGIKIKEFAVNKAKNNSIKPGQKK
jgi:hypothetical protein